MASNRGLIGWLREMRATLAEHDFATAAMLTHGSCWVDEQDPRGYRRLRYREAFRASRPSEPFGGPFGEAATHGRRAERRRLVLACIWTWKRFEALGLRPKNTPTICEAAAPSSFARLLNYTRGVTSPLRIGVLASTKARRCRRVWTLVRRRDRGAGRRRNQQHSDSRAPASPRAGRRPCIYRARLTPYPAPSTLPSCKR